MCGFVGIFGHLNINKHNNLIESSMKYFRHRGPDDNYKYINKHIALGFHRLSIQDLSNFGRQPMQSLNKRFVIVFNGEIYNFKLLKKDLIKKGYKFRSNTDTEVLLNLYLEYKEKCLKYIEGMYAFCIYDNLKKNIFIARDKFGIKPLYYIKTKNNNLIFASELKSFLPFINEEKLDWSLNEKKLNEQIEFRFLAGNDTLVRNVKKLNPGEYLFKGLYEFKFKKYYKSVTHTQSTISCSKKNFLENLDEKLRNSIKEQTISDAKIGVALSGGLDSSLLVHYMKDIKSKINTFSVNVKNEKNSSILYDEREYIEYIKRKYSTNHKSINLSEQIYKNIFLKCLWHNDEPINFPHTPGIFLLSKIAKQTNTKVLLGGEGADEFFGGYQNLLKNKTSTSLFKYCNFNKNNAVLIKHNDDFAEREKILKKISEHNAPNKRILYSIQTYLQSIENRLDKMSMANSVEFRVPFLKAELLDMSISNNSKSIFKSKIYTKIILRKLAEKYFKKSHIYRPKIGFSIPINNWMRNKKGFGEYIDFLREKKTLERGVYNKKKITRLIDNFYKFPKEDYKFSNAGKIWNLLNLELWIRSFIENKQELK